MSLRVRTCGIRPPLAFDSSWSWARTSFILYLFDYLYIPFLASFKISLRTTVVGKGNYDSEVWRVM